MNKNKTPTRHSDILFNHDDVTRRDIGEVNISGDVTISKKNFHLEIIK